MTTSNISSNVFNTRNEKVQVISDPLAENMSSLKDGLQIVEIAKDAQGFPSAFNSTNLTDVPEKLFAIGEVAILESKLVAVSFSKYTAPSEVAVRRMTPHAKEQVQAQQAAYLAAYEWGRAAAKILAENGLNVIVSGLRPCDIGILKGVIAGGGKAVVFFETSLRSNVSMINSLEKYIAAGQLVFVSLEETADRYNKVIAGSRNAAVVALAESGLCVDSTSDSGGAFYLPTMMLAVGKSQYVRPSTSEGNQELVRLYHATMVVGETIEEQVAMIINGD